MQPTDMPDVAGKRNKTPAPHQKPIASAVPQGNRPAKILKMDLAPEVFEDAGAWAKAPRNRKKPKGNGKGRPRLLETMEGLRT